MYPSDLKYTEQHEWARLTGDTVRIGITSFAQESLGDIVFVQLPSAGTEVEAGSPLGEVESTKSVSDLYAPVTGTVVSPNPALDTQPELLNSDPYGEGWLLEIRVESSEQYDALLDVGAYEQHVGGV